LIDKNNIKENNKENEENNEILKEKDNKNENMNILAVIANQEINQKNLTFCLKSNFKTAYYQYVNNNNCSSSNKSKDKETKSKQTKYLIGNNEALNHLIYFTNASNKSGILPGTSSKTKSDADNGNG
jgi:hypothetical protein